MTQEEIQKHLDNLAEKIKGEVVSKSEFDKLQSEHDELSQKLNEKIEAMSEKDEAVKALETQLETVKGSLNDMAEKMEKQKAKETSKPMTLKDAILEVVNQKTEDGKSIFREMISKNRKSTFDMKVATSDFVGDAYRTERKPGITFEKLTENTIMPIFNMVTMPAGKDIITWLEGAATINVGYVSEGTSHDTDSSGSATAKTRDLAKISAVMPFTTEALDMPEAFAERLQRRMVDATEVWLDQELLSGNGDDSTQPNHIYGLETQGSTAFSAPTGLTFDNPNIDDLVEACLVQATPYKPTHVLMNRKTYAKWSREKDTTGQYVIREVNGMRMLSGLQVVISEGMNDDALMTVDRAVLEFWVKDGMRMIVTQMDGTDISDDKWKAILFWRGQALVEAIDKKANIYVSNIETEIENISTVTP